MQETGSRRDALLLTVAVLGIGTAMAGIAWLDIPRDPVGPYLGLHLLASLCWLVALGVVRQRPPDSRVGLSALFLGAVGLRVVAWWTPYVLETDIHRYLWDGYVLSHGFNPYAFSPARVRDAMTPSDEGPGAASALVERDQRLLRELWRLSRQPEIAGYFRRINHPGIPTCYPPLAEVAFAISARVAPGDPRLWKAIVATADLVICALIVVLLGELGRPRSWFLAYAWCPLVLKEYANTGHFDPLATVGVLSGLVCLLRGRHLAAGLFLGIGAAVKLYPLVLLPVLGRRLGWGGVAVFLAVPVLAMSPFLGPGASTLAGLLTFAARWEFNSSLFAVLWTLTGWIREPLLRFEIGGTAIALDGFVLAKLAAGALLIAWLGWLAREPDRGPLDLTARVAGAIGGLLLLSPIADPWYLAWVLPFGCVFPLPSLAYLAVSGACYYLYFLRWEYLWWHRWLEYGPFFLLLCRDLAQAGRGRRAGEGDRTDLPFGV